MTWALVPLTPKAETPARRGSPVSGHGTGAVTSSTAPADQSTCVDGASTCSVGGTIPCRIAATILITPAMPAAGLRMSDVRLHRPQQHGSPPRGPFLAIRRDQRLRLDRIPQRGPGPVRLHHIHLGRTQPGAGQRRPDHPLLRRAIRSRQTITRPVLIHRTARNHRQHPVPPRRASESRSTTSTPTPSEKPVPSAASANALHRPSAASPRCRENS